MAGRAAANGSRSVGKFALHDGTVMTLEAELGAGGTQHVFVGRLMRIMAGKAFALFDRQMDVLLGVEPLVALRTEVPGIFNLFKGVFSFRFMAENAIACRHRTMDVFVGSHAVMAIGCFACFFGGEILVVNCAGVLGEAGKQRKRQSDDRQEQKPHKPGALI